MRLVRATTVVVVVLIGLFAALGAGSATATKLCKVKAVGNACPAGEDLKSGTPLKLTQKTYTPFQIGLAEVDCNTATLEGETTSNGGGVGTEVKFKFKTRTWENCLNCEVEALRLSWNGGFRWTEGNGGLAEFDSEFKFDCGVDVCQYEDILQALVPGGAPASFVINKEALPKSAGPVQCTNPMIWTATYTISSPSPMYLTRE
jgi:hypothetical protein